MILFKVFDLHIVLFRILDQLSFLKSASKKNFSRVDIKKIGKMKPFDKRITKLCEEKVIAD